MDQRDRLLFLIKGLIRERSCDDRVPIPDHQDGREALFRALVNERPPMPASDAWMPFEIPVSMILGTVGAIVFIIILLKQRKPG